MRRISAQQSEASFSSQQRPRETAEVSAEPEEEQDPPAEPQTFKEKFLDKLKGIMPSPERALETCQEDTGAVLWQKGCWMHQWGLHTWVTPAGTFGCEQVCKRT